jgi:hypothetical protein
VANGLVIGLEAGRPFRIGYEVRCDGLWRVREVRAAAPAQWIAVLWHRAKLLCPLLAPRQWRLSWTRSRLGLCLKHAPKRHRTSPMGPNELLKGSVRHVELIFLLGEAVQPSAVFVDEQDVPG